MKTNKWIQFSPEAGILRSNEVEEVTLADGSKIEIAKDVDLNFHKLPPGIQAQLTKLHGDVAKIRGGKVQPVKPEPAA